MQKTIKLWGKDWELNAFVENFETKDDITLDQKLTLYDVLGSLAHAKMLNKISILSESELKTINKGLREIFELDQKGQFELSIGDEDIHTKIENYLTTEYGEVGKKIHAGRSRNDQVLTALRLFTKNGLLEITEDLIVLTKDFIQFSKNYENIQMPGYTHMQKAMPYTIGAWAESYISGFIDDLKFLKSTMQIIDQSPLGSAAGFGTSLENNRDYTAKILGFSEVQKNFLYSQNSKGKFEGIVIASLISILSGLNKFATDVLLFTTQEFNFLNVDPTLQTGSSIMPQKRNLDIAELIRSKVYVLIGNYNKILGITSNLISGYNRDTQDIKKPLIESLEVTADTIQATSFLLAGITPNKKKLEASMTNELYATDKALTLVKNGVPFREAYKTVAGSIKEINRNDFKIKISLNSTFFSEELSKFEKEFIKNKTHQFNCFDNLLKGIDK